MTDIQELSAQLRRACQQMDDVPAESAVYSSTIKDGDLVEARCKTQSGMIKVESENVRDFHASDHTTRGVVAIDNTMAIDRNENVRRGVVANIPNAGDIVFDEDKQSIRLRQEGIKQSGKAATAEITQSGNPTGYDD